MVRNALFPETEGKGDGVSRRQVRTAILKRMIREGLMEKTKFKQHPSAHFLNFKGLGFPIYKVKK